MTHSDPTSATARLDVRGLGRDAALLAWVSDEGPAMRGFRILIGQETARPPIAHTSLPLGMGRVQNLVALRLVGPTETNATITVCDNTGHALATADTRAHGRSIAGELDPQALLGSFEPAARVRAARFLLEICANALRLDGDPEFVGHCRHILGEISRNPGGLHPRCRVLDRYVLCEGTVPAGLGTRLTASILGAETLRRAAFAPALIADGAKPGRATVALLLDKAALDAEASIVIFGESGMACRRLAASPPAASALDWLSEQRPSAPMRRYLLDCLARLGEENPQAAALLRELQILGPQRGQVLRHDRCAIAAGADLILGTETGVFVAGWVNDPHCLVDALEIDRAGRTTSVALDHLHRYVHQGSESRIAGSLGFAGFVAEETRALPEAPCRLRLRLRSGAFTDLAEGPSILPTTEARDVVLASIPPEHLSDEALAALEPAIAALQSRSALVQIEPEIVTIGSDIPAPVASIIVPLGAEPDLVRCRIGLFATDPGLRAVEVLYLLDRVQDRVAAERLLRQQHDAFGVSARLVAMPEGCNSGLAFNAAARIARGSILIFMGSGVVPEQAGWFAGLNDFLLAHPRCGVAAARVVHDDHSITSAGFSFDIGPSGLWDLQRPFAGFPREFAGAARADSVAAASTDCLAVRRSLFELVGDFAEDYVAAAYRDADFCLRVRARGLEVWRLATPTLIQLGTSGEPHELVRAALARRLLERRWRSVVEAGLAANAQDAPAHAAAPMRLRAAG